MIKIHCMKLEETDKILTQKRNFQEAKTIRQKVMRKKEYSES